MIERVAEALEDWIIDCPASHNIHHAEHLYIVAPAETRTRISSGPEMIEIAPYAAAGLAGAFTALSA
jgi:hypothetical protein